jgi:Na+-driven multidrug efflux pump
MQDLTTGPITRHLLKTTSFMLVTMVFQTLYFLIDLYWVGRLGTKAVAAVGIAGNVTFIVLALTQMLGVGTTAVVSHAVGRKDRAQALLLFNQSQVLAMVVGVAFLAAGMAVRWPYARAMSADAETAALAAEYLLWFIPAMALQFALVAMGSALRAVGNFKPGMVVSTRLRASSSSRSGSPSASATSVPRSAWRSSRCTACMSSWFQKSARLPTSSPTTPLAPPRSARAIGSTS